MEAEIDAQQDDDETASSAENQPPPQSDRAEGEDEQEDQTADVEMLDSDVDMDSERTVAVVAPRGAGVRVWERVLLGCTLPVLVISTLALSYYPHGTLVGFGLEAAALAAWGLRPAPAVTPAPTASVGSSGTPG